MKRSKSATFRFYEELNDFLPPERRKVSFTHLFSNNPAIKDVIESLGVPHTEVDLVVINDISVDFTHQLQDGERVSVYPMFESIDISNATRLREIPLRDPKFILDVHLGKLAKHLRLLGFDILYNNHATDAEIIAQSLQENRCILTRDKGLLKNKTVTRGYWMRATDPFKQVIEILQRFDLASDIKTFTRCLECNDFLIATEKEKITDRLDPKTKKYYHQFVTCPRCHRIYWQGSHYQEMKAFIDRIIRQ